VEDGDYVHVGDYTAEAGAVGGARGGRSMLAAAGDEEFDVSDEELEDENAREVAAAAAYAEEEFDVGDDEEEAELQAFAAGGAHHVERTGAVMDLGDEDEFGMGDDADGEVLDTSISQAYRTSDIEPGLEEGGTEGEGVQSPANTASRSPQFDPTFTNEVSQIKLTPEYLEHGTSEQERPPEQRKLDFGDGALDVGVEADEGEAGDGGESEEIEEVLDAVDDDASKDGREAGGEAGEGKEVKAPYPNEPGYDSAEDGYNSDEDEPGGHSQVEVGSVAEDKAVLSSIIVDEEQSIGGNGEEAAELQRVYAEEEAEGATVFAEEVDTQNTNPAGEATGGVEEMAVVPGDLEGDVDGGEQGTGEENASTEGGDASGDAELQRIAAEEEAALEEEMQRIALEDDAAREAAEEEAELARITAEEEAEAELQRIAAGDEAEAELQQAVAEDEETARMKEGMDVHNAVMEKDAACGFVGGGVAEFQRVAADEAAGIDAVVGVQDIAMGENAVNEVADTESAREVEDIPSEGEDEAKLQSISAEEGEEAGVQVVAAEEGMNVGADDAEEKADRSEAGMKVEYATSQEGPGSKAAVGDAVDTERATIAGEEGEKLEEIGVEVGIMETVARDIPVERGPSRDAENAEADGTAADVGSSKVSEDKAEQEGVADLSAGESDGNRAAAGEGEHSKGGSPQRAGGLWFSDELERPSTPLSPIRTPRKAFNVEVERKAGVSFTSEAEEAGKEKPNMKPGEPFELHEFEMAPS
jgi:hypothetical protein